MDKTIVLKEIDVDWYTYELMDFEKKCHSVREEGYCVYVKLTPEHFTEDGYGYYHYWNDLDMIMPNLDFNINQWHIAVIDYLVFVDGDKTKVFKNRFGEDQKMVIVS